MSSEPRRESTNSPLSQPRAADRVCHDLRSPLSAILCTVELLEDELCGPITQKQRDALASIARAVQRERHGIDRLYTLLEVEHNAVTPPSECVDVTALLAEIVVEAARAGADRRIEVSSVVPEEQVLVRAHRRRLAVALRELVAEALFASSTGDKLVVRAMCTADSAWIEIPRPNEGASDEHEFGLALARFAVRGVGGRLDLAPNALGGACARLALPTWNEGETGTQFEQGFEEEVVMTNEGRAVERTVQRTNARNATVLVIEDEPDVNWAITRRLDTLGFETLSTSDGESALFLLAAMTPDLVVLDLHLPRMNGQTLLQRLRESPAISSTPVILITGDRDPSVQEFAEALGVARLLYKPVSQRELVAEIQALVNARTPTVRAAQA